MKYVNLRSGSWLDVCQQAKKESNICADSRELHPKLRFRGLRPEDLENLEHDIQFFNGPIDPSNTIGSSTRRPLLPTTKAESFDQLPDKIQMEILGHNLIFDDVIHAISRLDEWVEPDEAPEDGINGVKLLHRFHIGSSPVCLTYAIRPEILLAPLRVSKAWNVMGCYIFYGLNTFAFSSLGE